MRTVGVKLLADISGYVAGMKRAQASTADLVTQMDRAAKSGHLDAVADRAGMAGIALVGLAGYAVKTAADFEKSMSGVQAATHASAGEIDALRKAALQAGKDTSFSATEAAQGITELSKAGVATADVLGGGLKGALDLAAAGQLEVGEAAETAASAMTQFKLKGADVPHIADLLAAAAGKAQGSVHDMGQALNQAGLVAAQMGLSIEDTTGTLAAFASAGLIGSDSGTSLKTAMLMLANPTAKARDLMEELGIQTYDAQGQFVGIAALAGQLKTQLGGLTQEQRNAALATIFGSDAIRAASILYEQGADGIQGWINKVDDAGYASETAKIQTDNLIGDLERLKGSLETLAIESGGGASGGLRFLVQGLDEVVEQFGRMPPAVGSSLVALAGIGGIAALALAAFIKLRAGMASAVDELNKMGPAGARAATGLQKAAAMAGKAALAFAALEVGAAAFNSMATNSANVDKLTASLTNLAKTGESAGELNDVFGKDFDKLGRIAGFAASANHGYGKFVNTLADSVPIIGDAGKAVGNFGNRLIAGTDFDQAKQQMAALDTALTNFMNTTDDAKKASELWNKVAAESGIPIDQLIELLPNAYKKVGELNTAAMQGTTAMNGMATGAQAAADGVGGIPGPTDAATGATKEYATAAEAAAAAAHGEREALAQLSDQMKAEADPVFGLLTAQQDLTKAQKDAAEAVKKHGRNSDEAKEATQNLALAAIDLQGKVGELGSTFDGELSPSMIQTLRNAKLTDAQIADVAAQFRVAKRDADAYSGNYNANVRAPGATTARNQIRSLKAELASMKTNWSVTIRQNFLTFGKPYSQAGIASGRVGGLAAGGPVEGPGPKGVDSELRLLAPGEHVLSAPEVDALGGHRAVAEMRSAALSTDGGSPTSTRVMPAGTAPQKVIVEVHTVADFRNAGDAMGRALAGVLRNNAGIRTTIAETLAGS